ncbi:MAG: hypothetical protein ACM31C_00425 [Acidobacteriota bacterium]
MPSVIVRDAVAADHLVYAWPFPIGPEEYEVACADDELVVMCPAWMVGDRLGPGRHRWRTPDPTRPVSAFFVLTAPVEVSFDMTTQFVVPTTGQPVRLRANGSLQVRCGDPALLVAQFVGLPFDSVNEGVLRSVSRSVERMLARLLTRRVVMAGTPVAVTDPGMLPNIVEELVAYNPAAGAVFGVELVRMGHVTIYADDGTRPWHLVEQQVARVGPNGDTARSMPQGSMPEIPLRQTMRAPGAIPPIPAPPIEPPELAAQGTPPPPKLTPRVSTPPPPIPRAPTPPPSEASGEIVVRGQRSSTPPPIPSLAAAAGTPDPHRVITSPVPRKAQPIEVPQTVDEITQPGIDIVRTPLPGSIQMPTPPPNDSARDEPRGAILGIGTGHIGASPSITSVASGEIPTKMAPGARVLVPGPNGLMQSATVRQLLQGYYELEVGGSGETIWVPMNGVVPESS